MSDRIPLPYGTWPSLITPELVASEGVRYAELSFDGDELLWLERRPQEGGRSVVVGRDVEGRITDRIPKTMNARSLVHEYGGGAYRCHRGQLYFVNFDDQDLYISSAGAAPRRLTREPHLRFADLCIDERRDRLIAVAEDHEGEGEASNRLVSIDLKSGSVSTLVAGADFYSNPVLSSSGARLAWLSWHHPDMPWDATTLWCCDLVEDGSVGRPTEVAGCDSESVFQPRWSAEDDLYFVSDRSGWWNLYRSNLHEVTAVAHLDEEMGLPQWVFGMSTWDFTDGDRIVIGSSDKGRWRLLEIADGCLRDLECPYPDITSLCAATDRVGFVGASSSTAPSVVIWHGGERGFEVVRGASTLEIDEDLFSRPRSIEFPCSDCSSGHAFFYPPSNGEYHGPGEERPMLLVLSHGGPTSAASSGLNLAVQYWTSRGFAVVDVNYRGSTGYGRRYREALKGQWGIADVDDCVAAALHLVEIGEVDPRRLAIRGGSAGGYTTLAALAFRDVFAAGASYYGIGDLEALVRDTHKFESRYLDGLIGPYPEKRDLYRSRSPLHFAGRLSCPAIFFQGLEDKVVPPNQAESMVEALRDRGLAVAYVPFAGEQHGFRRAENICRALESELYFYSQVFGFEPADALRSVEIFNRETLEGSGDGC